MEGPERSVPRLGCRRRLSDTALAGATGVLFLEDIIEELIGDIEDATTV